MARPDASAKLAATKPKQGPSKALIAAVIATVLVLGAAVAFFMTDPFAEKDAAAPKGANAGGAGIDPYPGKAKPGVPTVDIYEDFQCPACKQFETANGQSIDTMARAGKIKVVYHVLSFLDNNLGNDSSKKAANAAFCAADQGKFPEYHKTVFANQPENEGTGYTPEQLNQFAEKSGITGGKLNTFKTCVQKGTHDDYVEDTQKKANDDKVTGTPTVKVNGKMLDQQQMQQLGQPGAFPMVVEQAAKK